MLTESVDFLAMSRDFGKNEPMRSANGPVRSWIAGLWEK
jgi:hypothetical protein